MSQHVLTACFEYHIIIMFHRFHDYHYYQDHHDSHNYVVIILWLPSRELTYPPKMAFWRWCSELPKVGYVKNPWRVLYQHPSPLTRRFCKWDIARGAQGTWQSTINGGNGNKLSQQNGRLWMSIVYISSFFCRVCQKFLAVALSHIHACMHQYKVNIHVYIHIHCSIYWFVYLSTCCHCVHVDCFLFFNGWLWMGFDCVLIYQDSRIHSQDNMFSLRKHIIIAHAVFNYPHSYLTSVADRSCFLTTGLWFTNKFLR